MFFILNTISSSVDYFPAFISQLFYSLLLVVVFSLPILLFIKQKLIPKKLFIVLAFYLNVSFFIVVTDFLARLGLTFQYASIISFSLIVFLGLIGGFQNRKKLFAVNNFLNSKSEVILLLLATFICTFIFGKFIYQNGLHDEWQHHFVVENMSENTSFPIVNEYKYFLPISDYYHYGLYFIPVLIKNLFPVDIEVSLDLAKLFLFLPIIPLFYFGIEAVFSKLNKFEKIFFSLVLLFQGPSLFLFDDYSKNVLFGIAEPIVYQPLFFQLAGLTWFGLIFSIVFSGLFYFVLKLNNLLLILLYSIFSFYTVYLVNKAYIVLLLINYLLLFLFFNFKKIKNKLIFSIVICITLFGSGYYILQKLFPLLFSMLKMSEGIPFFRDFSKIGMPYGTDAEVEYLSLFKWEFIKAFGIMPLISAIIFLNKKFLKNKLNIFFFILFMFCFFIPYFINLNRGELSLNKFFIPFMFATLTIILSLYCKLNKKMKLLIVLLLSLAVVSPLLYFSSASLIGMQQYWNYSDKIVQYLSKHEHSPVVLYDDFEYAKYLVNTSDVKMIYYKIYNIEAHEKPLFYISSSEIVDYELVEQTENKYLYKL